MPKSSGGSYAAYFGDERGYAYALDADTGALLWRTQLEKGGLLRVIGAPALYRGYLYVPLSSLEEVAAGLDPKYPCCKFRGSVTALDAVSGKIRWKSYAIPEEPRPTKINSAGAAMFGPAGASIWTAPTIDAKRGLIYVGTGDSYTSTPTDAADAIVAFDLKTGKRRWVTQVLANDNWIMNCKGEAVGNCPTPLGRDLDFGASPILKTLPNGKQIILAASKGAMVYGLDPEKRGQILWRQKLGEGYGGAVIWGPAADDTHIYVPRAAARPRVPGEEPGVTAIKLATGARAWHTPAPQGACNWTSDACSAAQPAAATVIPGVLFAGSLDGHIRGYDSGDGHILWDFDTARTFPAVNGGEARGGSIDDGGQTVANGLLYVNSGNTTNTTVHRGNALLAFSVDGQ